MLNFWTKNEDFKQCEINLCIWLADRAELKLFNCSFMSAHPDSGSQDELKIVQLIKSELYFLTFLRFLLILVALGTT